MKTKQITLTGLFIALGVLIPIAFHMVGSGPALLPMHLPALLAGLFLGPLPGLIVGLSSPVLSCFLTGMPPPLPLAPIMAGELGVYGLTSGWLHRRQRLSPFVSLLTSMIAGRMTAGLVVAVLAGVFGFTQLRPVFFVKAAVTTGLPGIVLQFLLLPPLLGFLEKRYGDIVAGEADAAGRTFEREGAD